MQYIEPWLINVIKSPQFPWIGLTLIGLIFVEVLLHNKNESYHRIAEGVSSCFGMFCVYVLTAILFGPIHHTFLEKLGLSSCLPFLSDTFANSEQAVFCIFKFPEERIDLCYGILKLFIICLIYNLIGGIIEKSLKGKKVRFLVWSGIQIAFIFIFTIIISSFNYIIERLCYYVPGIGRMVQFVRDEAMIICVCVVVVFLVLIITKIVFSFIREKNTEDIPVLGFISKLFFENTFGAALMKATITTYFLIMVFKIITITYINTFALSGSWQLIFLLVLMLLFLWYMIRQQIYRE